ncbi:hypothetical protein N7447_002681 [Penicillium robsamsonii]|uniref:uncharacterized protein n=1 Tax=Penicillium robsamsonii TaxID=1792511 RepID=UPI0025490B44|nr:uncharacterized protein N7447_002681 [Penicillium robsamsonii]KAJ5836655.1 hypothetical protein N7447_002681 [Penicillium robsamsonii]
MSSTSSAASSAFSRASAHSLSFSSISSDSSPFSGVLHVDHQGFLKSSHRAGGPVLTSLPALATGNTFTNNPVQLCELARKTLRDLKLDFSEVGLTGRISKVDPEPAPIPTLVIFMPDISQPDLWYEAAKQIHRDLEPQLHGISVEMIEEKLYAGAYCFPVEQTHSIYPKWKSIAEIILINLNIEEWTGLECWRYGTNPAKNLNPVTIIVQVEKSSTQSFLTANQTMRGILTYFNESGVDILFMKDGKQNLVENPMLDPNSCRGAIHPGVSLGIHGSSAVTSTLGGFVQLRFSGQSHWHTYGLTCFHAVWPPEWKRPESMLQIKGAVTALSQWEYGPLRLEHPPSSIARQILKVDHPSLKDLQHTINVIDGHIDTFKTGEFLEWEATQRAIDQGEDLCIPESAARRYKGIAKRISEFKAVRQQFATMRDNRFYFLGHVIAASGVYRTKKNDADQLISMDWALIDIDPGRLQPQIHGNKVEGNRPFGNGPTGLVLASEFQFNPQLKVHSGMMLYKTGRSSGATSAPYNGLIKVDICRQKTESGGFQKIPTWVHSVANETPQAFAEPGDSGSWVYTNYSDVFGMVLSGNERLGTASISSIFDIFKDIKVLTDAAEVRIAPGPPLP